MSELALKLIKEAKAKRLKRLDLGNCGLTELPCELFELTWLTELNFSTERSEYNFMSKEWLEITTKNIGLRNNIKNIAPEFAKLKELRKLWLNDDFESKELYVTDLTPIKNLRNLILLDISGTHVSELPNLNEWENLKQLNISNTDIVDLSPISKLYRLKFLQMRRTNVVSIKPLSDLVELEFLNISITLVSDLTPLKKLKNLYELYAFSTKILDIDALVPLKKIHYLLIQETQIKSVEPLKNHSNLKSLNINATLISDLTPLKDLTRLQFLDISDTPVSDLSSLKAIIKNGIHLSYQNCQLINPPLYVVEQGNEAMLHYWQDIESKEIIINNQTKLIFVGNSRAGKTSLWQFLKDKIYDKNASSTHGIKTEIWDKESLNTSDNQQLAVHIWDFGGQEYYHATHRLFLSDNAIYVLVWEEESNFKGSKLERFKLDDAINGEMEEVELDHFSADYWLNNIRHYSRNSPILIVQNKVDEAHQKVNYTEGVQNPYDCFHLSVQNAFYFQEGDTQFEEFNLDFQSFKLKLLRTLRKNATALTILKYYAQVREKLEKLRDEKEYISLEELNAIALIYDETPDMQNLLAYLKSFTNTVLYFPNNQLLKDRLYLNPKDISQAIYKILNKEVRKNDGKFDLIHIQNCLNCDAIEAERYVALMIEFDLIFEKNKTIKNEIQRQFTTPQYLPKKEDLPTGILLFINAGIFEKVFEIQFKNFVPRSLMLRFIANNGAKANEETYWHNGIVYTSPLTQSMIKVEYDNELTFTICVQSKIAQVIDMQDIVKQFERLEPDTRCIKISNNGQNYVDLNNLYKCLRDNRTDKIQTNEGVIISIKDYEWLIEKQKNKELIVIENIKKQIQNLIGAAKIKEALDRLSEYASDTNNAQLTQNAIVLKGNLTRINEQASLLISYADANIEINRLGNSILELLNSLE